MGPLKNLLTPPGIMYNDMLDGDYWAKVFNGRYETFKLDIKGRSNVLLERTVKAFAWACSVEVLVYVLQRQGELGGFGAFQTPKPDPDDPILVPTFCKPMNFQLCNATALSRVLLALTSPTISRKTSTGRMDNRRLVWIILSYPKVQRVLYLSHPFLPECENLEETVTTHILISHHFVLSQPPRQMLLLALRPRPLHLRSLLHQPSLNHPASYMSRIRIKA